MASTACLKSLSTKGALKSVDLSSSKNGLSGTAVAAPVARTVVSRKQTVCRAEAQGPEVPAVSRRAAVAAFVAAVAATKAAPAFAAYGEAANVFGSAKKDTSFNPYTGVGFSLKVPSKWNPSKEQEFEGTVYRAEDNFDATNNLSVLVLPTSQGSVEGYGSPEEFVNKFSYLFGKQAYFGKTDSEGGFKSGVVAKAAFLGAETPKVDGKTYYRIEVLTTTADGDEGGKHQLISATVNKGKLYLVKAQAGDKRWFKGAKKFIEGAVNSFTVA